MENDNPDRLRENTSNSSQRSGCDEESATGASHQAAGDSNLTGNVVADQTRNLNEGQITANIVVNASHTHIDQRGATIIVQHVTPGAEGKQDVGLKENGVKGFMEAMKKHLLNETEISITSTFDNLNEMDPKILPSMGVVDFTKGNEGKISRESGNVKDSGDGTDFGSSDIKLYQLHDSYKGQNPNRVFLLGDSGSGKTTAAKIYARMVLNGEIESLKHIELVHFISISDLQHTRTTAFDLLVSRQIGLDENMEACGEKWLAKNASKTLFVLDGLDQSAKVLSGRFPKVAKLKAKASTNEILANILSGVLYPGLNILVTSRQNAFWKLEHKLRSSKTVVLRGFGDQNLKNAANTLAGGNEGDKIIAALRNSSLLSLCQTPMFLIYAITVFKKNLDNPPDTITALMSAVFMHFKESDNCNDDFGTLTKLAYHATIKNRFTFTENYVRSIGIDPSKLGGLLTPRIRLLLELSRPTTENTTWSFPHQTLQEFLGALGIFEQCQHKFNRFVENELNKAELEIVRKFVYGMVLNPATRKACEPYLTDKSVSLEACKKTLMKQLDKFLAKDVIDDIKVISLLHECGPDVISHYKSRINRISINEEIHKPEDEHSLMSVAKQCVPMKEVRIQRMEMNPFFVRQIRGFIDEVENFEICTMTVGKHIMAEHCRELTDLVPKIKVDLINLWTTDNIASTLLQTWIDNKQAPCKSLWLVEQFSNDTFSKTGQLLSEFGPDTLVFYRCRLMKEKFKVLCDSMGKGAKLSELGINDDAAMAPEVYEDLTMFLNKGCVETLTLGKCGLTDRKLVSLNYGVNRNKVKLEKLHIFGETNMTPCTYRRLASTVGKTHVQTLVLNSNEVTAEKIEEFGEGAKVGKVKLKELKLRDDPTMKPEAYRSLACAIGKASVRELTLGNNQITDVKLQALEDGATESHVELEILSIFGEANMTLCTYRRLASTVGKTHVQTLVLQSNEVTAWKIEEFGDSADVRKVKLPVLHIMNEVLDRTTMRQLPTVVTKTQLTRLVLTNCKMTGDKFDEMSDAAKLDGIKIQEFKLTDKEMDEAAYHGLARAVAKAHMCILITDTCNITKKKLEAFGESAKENNAELPALCIMNEDLDITTMRQLPTVVTKTQLTRLILSNCKMTEDKFEEMSDAAKMDGIKLPVLHIMNEDLDITTMRQLPIVVTNTQLTRLVLNNCKMTEDKFDALADAAKMDGIKIPEFQVLDKEMDKKSYHGLGRAVGKAQIRILVTSACNLTENKLEAFGESAKENNAELDDFGIWDDLMDTAGFHELSKTMKTVNVNRIFIGNCSLTPDKLQSFKQSVKQNDVKFKMLVIAKSEDLNDDCYEEIIEICKEAKADLKLLNCNASNDRVRMLRMHISNVIGEPKFNIPGDRLPLHCGINAISAGENMEDITSPITEVVVQGSTKSDYWKHLQNDDVYRIEPHRPKGKVLIINNEFKGTTKSREGSEVDVKNMQTLWKALGFSTISKNNLTAEEIRKSCKEFADVECKNISVVVVIIMSHGGDRKGGKEHFTGEDKGRIFRKEVIDIFSSKNSKHLRGIPKVFMFQACRGSEKDIVTDDDGDTESDDDGNRLNPDWSDMLFAFPSQPGYKALRNTSTGSWLMNAVTKVFMEHAHDTHVADMLTTVNRKVSAKVTEIAGETRIQTSGQETYLRKKIFLFPGWPE